MTEHESLALKYRPRTFHDLAGQGPVQVVLYHMVRKAKVPTAILLHGQRGTGKTTTARILGAALNCRGWDRADPAPQIPCRQCPACQAVEAGNSLDVLEIDAASNGGVAEIRKLKELTYYSSPGDWRVVLLDEAHSMSPEAFNALLKVLEEPPPRTVFVLVTTEPGKIMPTVASRCHQFGFRRIPPAIITQRLRMICEAEGLAADDGLLDIIAGRADGALRDAVMCLDQVTSVNISDVKGFAALHGETDYAPSIVSAMAAGDHPAIFAALDATLAATGEYQSIGAAIVHCLRDVLVLAGGGTVTITGEGLAARQRLASQLETARIVAAMRTFWDLRTRARGADPRSSLELAAVIASDWLHPSTPPVASSNGNGSGAARLSTSEMAAIAAGGA